MIRRTLSHFSTTGTLRYRRQFISRASESLTNIGEAFSGPSKSTRRRRTRDQCIDTGLRIALVGRPNVGKSTLFNRLSRDAPKSGDAPRIFVPSVVHPFPGVTRDSREGDAILGDLEFTVIDTAGLEGGLSRKEMERAEESLDSKLERIALGKQSRPLVEKGAMDTDRSYREVYQRMAMQTSLSVQAAHGIFLVIDAHEGVTSLDEDIARWLRSELYASQMVKRVTIVANKMDRSNTYQGILEAMSLGLGDPIAISAEHNLGMADLFNAVRSIYEYNLDQRSSQQSARFQLGPASTEKQLQSNLEQETGNCVRRIDNAVDLDRTLGKLLVSIIGRPNVGKSTLLNSLVRRERAVMGPSWGVTRDTVLATWQAPNENAEPVYLIDTAGIRTTPNSPVGQLEQLSVKSSLRALRLSHICVVVLDASEPFTTQDIKLIRKVISEGRGIVLVLNKIDLLSPSERKILSEKIKQRLSTSLSDISGVDYIKMSGIKIGKQGEKLYEAIQRSRRQWETRIATSALTSFVRKYNDRVFLGVIPERRKGTVQFISQLKIRPPLFRFSGPSRVSKEYIRALVNSLRSEFGLEGVPVRYEMQSRKADRL